jgi:hypothetical protein
VARAELGFGVVGGRPLPDVEEVRGGRPAVGDGVVRAPPQPRVVRERVRLARKEEEEEGRRRVKEEVEGSGGWRRKWRGGATGLRKEEGGWVGQLTRKEEGTGEAETEGGRGGEEFPGRPFILSLDELHGGCWYSLQPWCFAPALRGVI